MISLPRKDLHGLTGLRISVSPATEPAWMQHCSDPLALVFPCQLCLECIWPAELCLCHNHAAQSGGSGQNPGSPPLGNPNKCMNELLSTWDPAFVQQDGSDPHMPSNISSYPGAELLVPCTSSVPPQHLELSPCPQPSFVLWVVRETLSCCAAGWQLSQLSRQDSADCLQCHWHSAVLPVTTLCHCPEQTLPRCSAQWGTQHITYQLFPSLLTAVFLGWKGFLVSIAKLQQKAVTCGTALWRQRECEVSPPSCCTVSYLQILLYSSGHCALSQLWKHKDKVNRSL